MAENIITTNMYYTNLDKDELSKALKESGGESITDFLITKLDGTVLYDGNSDEPITVSYHVVGNKRDNTDPELDADEGCVKEGVHMNLDITATVEQSRIAELFGTKLSTHISPKMFLGYDGSGTLDISTVLKKRPKAERGKRLPGEFKNARFIDLLVTHLHDAGKDTTKSGDPLDSAYILSLDRSTVEKAFTIAGRSPYYDQYSAALKAFNAQGETIDANVL